MSKKDGISSSSIERQRKSNMNFKSTDTIPYLSQNKIESTSEYFQDNQALRLKEMRAKRTFSIIKEESSQKPDSSVWPEREDAKSSSSIFLQEETPLFIGKEMQREDKGLEMFLGSVVHEFRQPINVFSTSLGIISEHISTIETIFSNINQINSQVKEESKISL